MATLIHQEGYDYAFDPSACERCGGHCCIGESGYIWVSAEEIRAIAHFLGEEESVFINDSLRKIRYRFSLKEFPYEGGWRCEFFDPNSKGCRIYPVRPLQCRTFPFWDPFKKNIIEVEAECPGIVRLS